MTTSKGLTKAKQALRTNLGKKSWFQGISINEKGLVLFVASGNAKTAAEEAKSVTQELVTIREIPIVKTTGLESGQHFMVAQVYRGRVVLHTLRVIGDIGEAGDYVQQLQKELGKHATIQIWFVSATEGPKLIKV